MRWRGPVITAVIILAGVPGIATGAVLAGAHHHRQAHAPRPMAWDKSRHCLVNPRLNPGARVLLTASGFAPKAQVETRLLGQPASRTIAGTDGTVRLAYTVPLGLAAGEQQLTVGGPGVSRPGSPQATANIQATVPNLCIFRFRVGPKPACVHGRRRLADDGHRGCAGRGRRDHPRLGSKSATSRLEQ
jgi:hypothetical protein